MKWSATEVGGFLERLRVDGEYASVPEMARAFRLSESTPRKWSGARRRTAPPAFTDFLRRYAEEHKLDARALRDEWVIRRADAPESEPAQPTHGDTLARAIAALKTNGRPELIEHLERQAHFLSMIPALAAQVADLSRIVEDLRAQLEPRDVHTSLGAKKAPKRATGPPDRKRAGGR